MEVSAGVLQNYKVTQEYPRPCVAGFLRGGERSPRIASYTTDALLYVIIVVVFVASVVAVVLFLNSLFL